MDIQIQLSFNGEPITPSTELQKMLDTILQTYVRQTLGEKMIKNKPKKTMEGLKTRWTSEDEKLLLDTSIANPDMKSGDLFRLVSQKLNKSYGSVYQKLQELKRKGVTNGI